MGSAVDDHCADASLPKLAFGFPDQHRPNAVSSIFPIDNKGETSCVPAVFLVMRYAGADHADDMIIRECDIFDVVRVLQKYDEPGFHVRAEGGITKFRYQPPNFGGISDFGGPDGDPLVHTNE